MTAPRVMIATPTPGRVATVFMKSVIATMNDLASNGIFCRFDTFDAADLPMQRNILATRFVESDCTHLFFVDSDMMFHENLCRAMLDRSKPMIGTVYAGKQFDFRRVAAAIEKGFTPTEAATFASDWLGYLPANQARIEVENGLLEVERVGFGVVLISRLVFERMIKQGVQRQQTTNANLGPFYNFFALRSEPAAHNQHVSEDASFCDRWRIDCGGKIWAYVDATVYHVGDFAYGGSYFEHLQAISRLQRDGQ